MFSLPLCCTVCLLIVAVLVRGNDDNGETPSVFVPTAEWQEIEPGQSIPAGLHVRMSLKTGLKEAKLMEDSPDFGDKRRADYHGYSDRRGVVNKRSKVFTWEEYMSMLEETPEQFSHPPALTHITAQDTHTHSGQTDIKQTGTRQTDIKQTGTRQTNTRQTDSTLSFDPPVTLHREAVTILELVHAFSDNEILPSKLVGLLEELEYHVHEIDNGRDLVGVGGVPVLLRLLNHTETDVRSHAALVLGSAAQR